MQPQTRHGRDTKGVLSILARALGVMFFLLPSRTDGLSAPVAHGKTIPRVKLGTSELDVYSCGRVARYLSDLSLI